MPTRNYGFNLDLELAHQSDSDWVYGATSQPCIAEIPEGERQQYLPDGELQNIGEEKMDCATRGPINIFEAKFTYLYQTNRLFPENRRFLEDHGYIVNGRVVFSDVFNAIKSGTTRAGNSLIAPLDSINNDGLVPKSMLPQLSSFDENYDPWRITNALEELGRQFKLRLKLNYERVYEVNYGTLLLRDFIDMAGYAWLAPVNGVYPNPGDTDPNHVFVGLKHPKYVIFDNYLDTDGDFIKVIAPDYNLLDFGYRCFIPKQFTQAEVIAADLSFLQKVLQLMAQLLNLQAILNALKSSQQPKTAPQPPQQPLPAPTPPTPHPDLLAAFCKGIEQYEGYAPGTRAYVNNNPGNLRHWPTQDGVKGGFAYFKTYEKGFAALKDLVIRAATGKSNVYKPTDNLLDFFAKYSPANDNNNPIAYAEWIGKKLAVDPLEFHIRELVA